MNKAQKKFVTLALLASILLPTIVITGCSENDQDLYISLPAPAAPFPVITNLWTPDSLVWTPYYHLPSGWRANLDNPESARSTTGPGLPAELRVFYLGNADEAGNPVFLRDQLYQQLYCQDEIPGSAINCGQGFIKTSQSIAGFQAEILRYHGTWRDDQQEVNEIFLNRDGQILHFSSEGDFSKVLPALQTMLRTISWKQQKPSTGPALEPEELGL